MAMRIDRFSVPGEGQGAPDYEDVIHRAAVWSRYNLDYLQRLRIFMIVLTEDHDAAGYGWVREPLQPWETMRLIDVDTAMPTPFTILEGNNLDELSTYFSFSRILKTQMFLQLTPAISLANSLISEVPTDTLGQDYQQEICGCGTTRANPTGAPVGGLQLDITGENVNDDEATGMGYVMWIQTEAGTPPRSTTKQVRCKWCGHISTAPVSALAVTCSHCDRVTGYQYHRWGGDRANALAKQRGRQR